MAMRQPLPPSRPLPGGDPVLRGYIMKTSTVFLLICCATAVNAVLWAISNYKLGNNADALKAEVSNVEDKADSVRRRHDILTQKLHAHLEWHEREADPDKDPECADCGKVQLNCAPERKLTMYGNRDHCMEVAEAPPGTSDQMMDRVGYEADGYLRENVSVYLRHGLGTRAKDRKRVVRYYNIPKRVAMASCQFLSCSQTWLDVEAKETPDVVRTCTIMRGKACDI